MKCDTSENELLLGRVFLFHKNSLVYPGYNSFLKRKNKENSKLRGETVILLLTLLSPMFMCSIA